MVSLIAALPAARTLDVACGSAFLTRHLRGGLVVGLDQRRAMVTLAQTRLRGGLAMVGNALELPALQAHRSSQAVERMAARAWTDPTLVFTTGVGTAIEPRNCLRAFHTLCDRAGVRRVRIHDPRHAAASFMLLQGIDLRVVMGTLGHSRLSTTSDLYTHLLEPVQQAAAARMDDLLREVSSPGAP